MFALHLERTSIKLILKNDIPNTNFLVIFKKLQPEVLLFEGQFHQEKRLITIKRGSKTAGNSSPLT